MRETYYVCPSCGILTTETEILEEIGCGSIGMCMCEYMVTDEDSGNVWFPRTLIPYKKISKKEYDKLSKLSVVERKRVVRIEGLEKELKRLKSEKK